MEAVINDIRKMHIEQVVLAHPFLMEAVVNNTRERHIEQVVIANGPSCKSVGDILMIRRPHMKENIHRPMTNAQI